MSANKSSESVPLTLTPDYPDVWLTKTEEQLDWLNTRIEQSKADIDETRAELEKLSERLDKQEAFHSNLTKLSETFRQQIYSIRELLKERQKNRERARA